MLAGLQVLQCYVALSRELRHEDHQLVGALVGTTAEALPASATEKRWQLELLQGVFTGARCD